MNWAIKNIGLVALALSICLAANSIDNMATEYRAMKMQVASAVTCHGDTVSNAGAFQVLASSLRPRR